MKLRVWMALGSGNSTVYIKDGKVYRFRWFRKDELIGSAEADRATG